MHTEITKKHIVLGIVALFVLIFVISFALNRTQITGREAMEIALVHMNLEDSQAFIAEFTLFEGRRAWRVEIGFERVSFFEVYVDAITGEPLRVFYIDPYIERYKAIEMVGEILPGSQVFHTRIIIDEGHRRIWHLEVGQGEMAFYVFIDATTGDVIEIEHLEPDVPLEDAVETALARVGGGMYVNHILCWDEQIRVWRIEILHEGMLYYVLVDTLLNTVATWGLIGE